VFDKEIDKTLRDVCLEVEKRYQLKFLEIVTYEDHVHLLVQSVPSYSVTKLVTLIKNITASEMFRLCPHVKKQLWSGEFGVMVILRVLLVGMTMNTRQGTMLRDRGKSIKTTRR
jgi:REP element-mobilizing transposase RayT